MQFKRSKRKKKVGINLTPLIDVVFLLVVFFMLTTRFAVFEAIPLSLKSSGGDIGQEAENGVGVITVKIHDNRFLVDNMTFTKEELRYFLKPRLGQNPERAVVIEPKEKASSQALVDAVDTVRLAGGKNLSVMTGGE